MRHFSISYIIYNRGHFIRDIQFLSYFINFIDF